MTKVIVKNQAWEKLGSIEAQSDIILLKQLEAEGIEIPNACRAGMCAACMCQVESGSEHFVKNHRGEPAFPLGEEEVMTCIGAVRDTDEEVVIKTMY